MNINSVSDFFGFVRSNGLTNLSPEVRALVVCLEEYGRICACDPESVRVNKFNQCKSFYMSFLKTASSYQNQLMSKVTDNSIVFYNDGQYVATVSR